MLRRLLSGIDIVSRFILAAIVGVGLGILLEFVMGHL